MLVRPLAWNLKCQEVWQLSENLMFKNLVGEKFPLLTLSLGQHQCLVDCCGLYSVCRSFLWIFLFIKSFWNIFALLYGVLVNMQLKCVLESNTTWVGVLQRLREFRFLESGHCRVVTGSVYVYLYISKRWHFIADPFDMHLPKTWPFAKEHALNSSFAALSEELFYWQLLTFMKCLSIHLRDSFCCHCICRNFNELEMQLEHERSRREKTEAKLDQYKLDNAYLMSQLQQLSESVRVYLYTTCILLLMVLMIAYSHVHHVSER